MTNPKTQLSQQIMNIENECPIAKKKQNKKNNTVMLFAH